MNYTPLRKKIVFSKEITGDINYKVAMEVIKSLGDANFKQWLVGHISTLQRPHAGCYDNEPLLVVYDEMMGIGGILESLVSREAYVDDGVIEKSKGAFLLAPNPAVIRLLKNIMGFLLDVQSFERMIVKIDNDIDNGLIQGEPQHLTRDGNPPIHLPRSMQPASKYKQKKRG